MTDEFGPQGGASTEVWTNAPLPEVPGDHRSLVRAVRNGALTRCPKCGAKSLYASFLKVNDACPACGEALHHHRADDAPPYFTIFAVGHLVLPALMTVEVAYTPPVWLHLLLWLPLTVALSLLLLPRIKGAIVGLQWANRMHGFGEPDDAQWDDCHRGPAKTGGMGLP